MTDKEKIQAEAQRIRDMYAKQEMTFVDVNGIQHRGYMTFNDVNQCAIKHVEEVIMLLDTNSSAFFNNSGI